ncbi:60S ribosomal protein L30 [Bonamia ostreae]|uniref:60S ribosomal protein L30 n=1 Tax=Bonamia ostreae TaxID=126728 RepID=A0ABV2AW47_9EUKA
MVATKKKSYESVNAKLKLVMKSGTVSLGFNKTLEHLRTGAAKLVIIANNCPPIRKSQIEYYSMLSKTNIHHYQGRFHH